MEQIYNCQPLELFKGKDLCMDHKGHAFFRAPIPAAQIAPIGD
jgi:hypothetical protein